MAAQNSDFDFFKNTIKPTLNAGWSNPLDLRTLVSLAQRALHQTPDFQTLFNDTAIQFNVVKTTADHYSSTVRFKQAYKGLEVFGQDAMVHFDSRGAIHDVTGEAVSAVLETTPTVSLSQARQILNDRYQQPVTLSEPAKLQIFSDLSNQPHLVYHMLTHSTATHAGKQVFLDAHTGAVVLETERAFDVSKGNRQVYRADTEEALNHVDEKTGYPTDINLSWYNKVIDNGSEVGTTDRSALNAYRGAGLTYAYYKDTFGRDSYDDQGSPIISIVHVGKDMNNAFWSNEDKVMAYGDGDGTHLGDLTYGLDVTAHELTHGMTDATAGLLYVAESGALNESYSDFFGKMVDYNGNWDIGADIMSPKWNRRALRNMLNPEEFHQPGTNDSPLRVATAGNCTPKNDRCGVHANSGIPNHAAALIVQAIGKEKAEKLYFAVLTKRLRPRSDFADARRQTEHECSMMFDGPDSTECQAVSKAFDEVKMGVTVLAPRDYSVTLSKR